MIRRPGRPLVPVLAAVILVGCTNDGSIDDGRNESSRIADLLLVEEDVPGAASSRDLDTLEVLSVCGPVTRPEGRLETFADEGYAVRAITTETSVGITSVVAAVFDGLSPATREVMIFANLEQGIELCSRDSPIDRGGVVERMTPLTGLPEGAVGYSSQITDQGVPEAVERAYADVGGQVLVVSARHVGGDQTGTDIKELLAVAIEKVERAAQTVDTQPAVTGRISVEFSYRSSGFQVSTITASATPARGHGRPLRSVRGSRERV